MTNDFEAQIATALLAPVPHRNHEPSAEGLPAWFDVSGLAVASLRMAAREIAAIGGSEPDTVRVDRRLAGMWFGWSIRPVGWEMPTAWDPIAGDYRCVDGWIRLHTNAPRHRAAALSVLQVPEDRAAVMAAVGAWKRDELEANVVEAGGCAAAMRSLDEWAGHPQGVASASEALISWSCELKHDASSHRRDPRQPMHGVKVLDLTRVLAGPVATRFLATFGADVLRIDPPDWEEPGVIPEVSIGKRCAGLDLRVDRDFQVLIGLIRQADILVHGYRPGALEALGLGDEARRAINPSLIDISLSAYGWTGPWRTRRGFDSLAQMSVGIAAFGMERENETKPTPLPVQALDHATGYLMAAAAIRALRARDAGGLAASARLSLARTAAMLVGSAHNNKPSPFKGETADDLAPDIEATAWGPARRLRLPMRIEEWQPINLKPAGQLRSDPPAFRTGSE